ncbi:type IX secretion system membrane protein PorP/SprF [Segetibacter sp. 3557_3]|uniref:PorP/SprF family type IX secretion system membrane protein n=1 Tax=Segetibacter sp. 3557_3 TaxID=2547429 RepID=UPI001059164F|nr:PorP/SprF family type IX secretion system membrane protein [Segetibacter sp. 3557_3]TDH27862.1 type IX secretion system membrane protein PorP/SprF [Segetibacter sp. 3557_3]
MKKLLNHKALLIALALVSASVTTKAQDLHFSQYFNAPLLVNPANTGFTPEGDYRVGINYRNQWASLGGNPYKTFSLYGDAQVLGKRIENGWLGVGGALLRDVAGSGNLTSTRAFGSVAYHQALGLGSLLSAGFNVGWVNKRVDFTKLTFDNQWNGKFFDVSTPSGEGFITNQINYFSLQAGLNYAYFPNDNTYLNAGISMSNINRPRESFSSSDTFDQRISRRYTTFLNGSFKVNDLWIVNPNIYVSTMATAWEVVAGVNAQRDLTGDGDAQLILGAYYRVKDAIVPVVGFQKGTYKLTFSYDATTSGLSRYNQTRGAYEISIVKQGLLDVSQPLKCPAVRF